MNKRKILAAANIMLWGMQGLYTVSPIDLIPDILPLIGWMDDLLGLAVTIAFTVYTVSVIRKHGLAGLNPVGRGAATRKLRAEPLGEPLPASGDSLAIPGYEPLTFEEIRGL